VQFRTLALRKRPISNQSVPDVKIKQFDSRWPGNKSTTEQDVFIEAEKRYPLPVGKTSINIAELL